MTIPVHHRNWTRTCLRVARAALAIAIILTAILATQSAPAQTFNVLYTFTGEADGGKPHARLVRDAMGNLYGTAYAGGTSGYGTVFKVDTAGKETVLYSFTGTGRDGANPIAGLVRDAAGNFYGATVFGGGTGCGGNGCGTVFKVGATGKNTVLHSFAGNAGGANPYATLVRDAAGNLYGTTQAGGAFGYGTVFKLAKTGKETVLHSFGEGADGEYPLAGLVRDAVGNLYGTTYAGTSGFGTVFEVDTTGKETVLYKFTGGTDGAYPLAGLIRDAAGNLYGTTGFGGNNTISCYYRGCGVVFKVDTTGKESVLYTFTGSADGAYPLAGLVRDGLGNLYGTTQAGGTGCGSGGCGTVFKVDATGKETVLYSFAGGTDGKYPLAGLVRDAAGNLYGTAIQGGASGNGTVFKIAKSAPIPTTVLGGGKSRAGPRIR